MRSIGTESSDEEIDQVMNPREGGNNIRQTKHVSCVLFAVEECLASAERSLGYKRYDKGDRSNGTKGRSLEWADDTIAL